MLYLWGEDQIIRKEENAHKVTGLNVPIMCLASKTGSNRFVSGGMDGRIIVWELQQEELKKVIDYHLHKGTGT